MSIFYTWKHATVGLCWQTVDVVRQKTPYPARLAAGLRVWVQIDATPPHYAHGLDESTHGIEEGMHWLIRVPVVLQCESTNGKWYGAVLGTFRDDRAVFVTNLSYEHVQAPLTLEENDMYLDHVLGGWKRI